MKQCLLIHVALAPGIGLESDVRHIIRFLDSERQSAKRRFDRKAALDMNEAEFSANLLAFRDPAGFGVYKLKVTTLRSIPFDDVD